MGCWEVKCLLYLSCFRKIPGTNRSSCNGLITQNGWLPPTPTGPSVLGRARASQLFPIMAAHTVIISDAWFTNIRISGLLLANAMGSRSRDVI